MMGFLFFCFWLGLVVLPTFAYMEARDGRLKASRIGGHIRITGGVL